MSTNKYSHASFLLFLFFFKPKINWPKAWRNGSGLHPELHKQMCEQPQLEAPHGHKLKVGMFPNKPGDCGREEDSPKSALSSLTPPRSASAGVTA